MTNINSFLNGFFIYTRGRPLSFPVYSVISESSKVVHSVIDFGGFHPLCALLGGAFKNSIPYYRKLTLVLINVLEITAT